MKTRIKYILVVALIVLLISVSAVWWIFPLWSTPEVSSGWWIVYNALDDQDSCSASWLVSEFGCVLKDMNSEVGYNVFGQNLIIIGCVRSLYIKAGRPAELSWPFPMVKQPDTYPNITWLKMDVRTPENIFQNAEGDYGVICRGYDYRLRRWIIVILGWTHWCAAAGVVEVINMGGNMSDSYIVYELISHCSDFPYRKPVDLTSDGVINADDVEQVKLAILELAPFEPEMDINANGKVDAYDLACYEQAAAAKSATYEDLTDCFITVIIERG